MEYRVEIGGKAVTLRYTVNSFCAMEDMAGGALDGLMDRQFTATRLLLWGGMLHENPGMALSEAGALVSAHLEQGGTLDGVVEMCAEAMRRAGFFGRAAQGNPMANPCAAGF